MGLGCTLRYIWQSQDCSACARKSLAAALSPTGFVPAQPLLNLKLFLVLMYSLLMLAMGALKIKFLVYRDNDGAGVCYTTSRINRYKNICPLNDCLLGGSL